MASDIKEDLTILGRTLHLYYALLLDGGMTLTNLL